MNHFLLAFITGLTTGGVSCLAVQGGLLASSLASEKVNKVKGVFLFLASKTISYTLLGALLGLVGSTLVLNSNIQGWMQIFAGVFMILTALKLLNIHPLFRYFSIPIPTSLFRIVRLQAKSSTEFSPAIVGFLTVFVPCGITQGMMILAIASGNLVTGASIMLGFTLGTLPIFLTLGILSTRLLKKKGLVFLASFILLFLGALAINNGQNQKGSVHTLQNYLWVLTHDSDNLGSLASIDNEGKQDVTINVGTHGYSSSAQTLRAGVPVKLTLITDKTQGCSRSFNIPTLNVSKVLPETGVEVVEFTPTATGHITYSCSMGMYTGRFNII